MEKLSLDVDMKDVSSIDTTVDITYAAFTDDDLRSPRTPTYAPTSPNFSKVAAFDPSRIFSSAETTIGPPIASTAQPAEPAKPLAWIWQCHLCNSRYPLSVTRRCLQDGHFYCSGETDRPNLKKRKRGKSCSSEFDYIGWREWGEWKRKALNNLENGLEGKLRAKGCLKCEFPSQCRYSSASTTAEKTANKTAMNEKKDETPSVSRTIEDADSSLPANETKNLRIYLSDSITFDSILESVTLEQNELLRLKKADLSSDTDTDTGIAPTKTSPIKSTTAALDHVLKVTEKRSSKKSTLSPIAEEFFFNADFGKTRFSDMALTSLDGLFGTAYSTQDEDRMDIT